MTDISVTAASVRPLNGALIRRGTAGATLTPGQVVYLDGTNGWKPADASAAASAKARGIVVSDGYGSTSFASGQAVDIVFLGPIEGFASMTPGASMYVSETAGALNTAAPSTASAAVVPMGWAESASIFFVDALDVVPGSAIADLTDNTGGAAADGTLAAITAAAAITDNSGGVDPGDDTIAAVTNQSTLTDNGAGTADATVEDVADIALSTSDTYTDAAVNTAVNAAIASISNNFKEYTTEQAKQVAANTAILAAIAQLAAKQNTTSTAIGVITDNEADLAAKINSILSALETAGILVVG